MLLLEHISLSYLVILKIGRFKVLKINRTQRLLETPEGEINIVNKEGIVASHVEPFSKD